MTWLVNPYRFGAPATAPAAYRHFRQSTRRAYDNLFRPLVGEFQLAASLGGANELAGASGVTYSTQAAGGEAYRAFDGVVGASSDWDPNVSGYAFSWIAKEVGAPFVPAQWLFGTTTANAWAPQYVDLWGSDDGSVWELLASLGNRTYTIDTLYDFDLTPARDGSYTDWRLWMAGAGGANATTAIREIELAETVGGGTVTGGGTTSQANAFDGNTATAYSIAVPATGYPSPSAYYPAIALSASHAIKEARVTAVEGSNPPGSMALQFRHPSDSYLWITVAFVDNLTWSGTETKSLVNPYV